MKEINEGELVMLIRCYAEMMKQYCDPESVDWYTNRILELNKKRAELLGMK